MKKYLILVLGIALFFPLVSDASTASQLEKRVEELTKIVRDLSNKMGATAATYPSSYFISSQSNSGYTGSSGNQKLTKIKNSLSSYLKSKSDLNSRVSSKIGAVVNNNEIIDNLINSIIRNNLYNIALIAEINWEGNYNSVCGANGVPQDPGIAQLIAEINSYKNLGTPTVGDVVCGKPVSGNANTYAVSAPLKPLVGALPYVCVDANNLTATSLTNPISPTSISCVGVVNASPTTYIISPTNGATFSTRAADPTLPSNFKLIPTITAHASDSDGAIAKVELYVNGEFKLELKKLFSPTYFGIWTPPVGASGNYTITVKAYDDKGSVTTSAPIQITLQP